jgi:CRISPR-associated exonuclease Cas4
MPITATLINYLMVCHRKVWLHANGIRLEHTSDVVAEGKLIGQESYPQRAERWTEIEVSGTLSHSAANPIELAAKIDFFDPHLGIVHEVKKSNAREQAHIAQVQFYLYVLRLNGIKATYGLIEYPNLRLTERVSLTDEDTLYIESQIMRVHKIIQLETCPERLPISKCRLCSFFEFCWVGEE